MVRENFELIKSYWKLPGGMVDLGESIKQAAVREVFEETGINGTFIGVNGFKELTDFRHAKGDMYFTCLMKATNDQIIR